MKADSNADPTATENFHAGELSAQQRWGTPGLWDQARAQQLLWHSIPEVFHPRIEAASFFFLSTSARDGSCDCSFKGGGPGLIRMLATDRLAFSDIDGNGAFMSLGNIMETCGVTLPCQGPGQLPVGLSLMATGHNEGKVLRLAKAAENALA